MPIYVDSRRCARTKTANNSFLSELVPTEAFEEELEHRHFDKKMAKAKVKGKGDTHGDSEKIMGKYSIKYNLNGFITYYKSANIRNKIRHPFYFSFHFHALLSLYYNK